jgi:hypothetical protein
LPIGASSDWNHASHGLRAETGLGEPETDDDYEDDEDDVDDHCDERPAIEDTDLPK